MMFLLVTPSLLCKLISCVSWYGIKDRTQTRFNQRALSNKDGDGYGYENVTVKVALPQTLWRLFYLV